jgi:DNA anti-recombination protein RmuC
MWEFLSSFWTEVRLRVIRIIDPRRWKVERHRMNMIRICTQLKKSIYENQNEWLRSLYKRDQVYLEYEQTKAIVQDAIRRQIEIRKERNPSFQHTLAEQKKHVYEWLNADETQFRMQVKYLHQEFRGLVGRCQRLEALIERLEYFYTKYDNMRQECEESLLIHKITSTLEEIKGVRITNIADDISSTINKIVDRSQTLKDMLNEADVDIKEARQEMDEEMGPTTSLHSSHVPPNKASHTEDDELLTEIFDQLFPNADARYPKVERIYPSEESTVSPPESRRRGGRTMESIG